MPVTLSASSISAVHLPPRPYPRPPSELMLSHSPQPHDVPLMHSWHTPSHYYPGNPYPVVSPPPSAHKVWILDCRSCGTFLTNRGMKAVLLLRPNVPLYSSDALPVNCSAYTSNPDALRPPACHHSTSTSAPRTCECLTQTLCCHGCGAAVGYMIVIPCTRCTSSTTTANRATNGHRFVFHSSEIVGSERHYVSDEPGVVPFTDPLPSPMTYVSYSQRAHPRFYPRHESSPAFRPDSHLPTPPLDTADASPMSSLSMSPVTDSFLFPEYAEHDHESSFPHTYGHSSHSTSHFRPTSPGSDDSDDSIPPPLESPPYAYGLPAEHTVTPPPRVLKPGDVLYWHHLSRHGEIPGVQEDVRARQKGNPAAKRLHYNR